MEDEEKETNTDNVYQPVAANVTEEGRSSEEVKVIHLCGVDAKSDCSSFLSVPL